MERAGGARHTGVDPAPIPVSLIDLYQMIGEREVLRHMQQKRITELMEENAQLRQLLTVDSPSRE